ncbi:hypothetical protein [Leptotrichia hongkongensis]|uniref:hypothetical protein n=1 Tax=Leptotrichia hongkongensis TaxID=554406 RepID=UPI0035A8E61C
MKDENIKLLIKNEYENGTSMSVLAKKYKTKLNTIKTWSAKEKWVKKKRNTTTKKGTTENSKKQPKKTVVIDKETQIKKDIFDNVPREEITEKHGIKKTKYYDIKKSVRQIQIEQSEKVLNEIATQKYNNAVERLKRIIEEKEKLETRILETTDKEEMSMIKQKLELLKEFEKDIKVNARVISDYRQAELEEQLVNNELSRNALEIQKERLEIEKAKIKNNDDKDSEKEKEMIELLKNITEKVGKDE